ncbi:hypothetical protein AAHC03_01758 [Spirometra sp. Aus1]
MTNNFNNLQKKYRKRLLKDRESAKEAQAVSCTTDRRKLSAVPQESSDESTQSRRFALEERCSQLESQLFAKSIEASDRKTQLDSLESAFRSRVDEIETQLSATTALKRAREEEILMLKSKIAAMEKPTRPSVRNFRSQIGPPNCSLKPLSMSSNGCVQTDLSSVHHELQKQVFEKQSTATMTSPYLNQSQPSKSDTIIVRLRKDILEKSKQISDLEETCATAADAIRSLQDQIRQQNDCCARRISELQASMAANTPPSKHVHTEGCQTEGPVFTNRGIDARSPGTCDSACQVDLDALSANAPSATNTTFPGFISEALLTLESSATFDRAISAATNSTAQGDTVHLSRRPVHAAPKSRITTEAATEPYQGSSVNLGSHFGEVSQPAVRPTTVSETEDSWLHVVTSPQECDARPATLIHDSERMVFSTSPSPWLPSGEEDAESLGSLSDCADFQLTVPPLLGFSSPDAQTTTPGAVEGVRVVTHSTIIEEGPAYLSSSKHASLCADQTALETWNVSTDAKANTFVSHCPTATASGVNSVPGNEAPRRVDLVVGQPSSHSVNDDITESPLQQISNFFDAAPPSSDEEDWDPRQVAAKFLADERSHSARLEKMLEWHLQSLRASSDLEFTARADLVAKPTRVTVEPTFAPTSSSEAPWLLADELRVGNDCTTVFVGVSN